MAKLSDLTRTPLEKLISLYSNSFTHANSNVNKHISQSEVMIIVLTNCGYCNRLINMFYLCNQCEIHTFCVDQFADVYKTTKSSLEVV